MALQGRDQEVKAGCHARCPRPAPTTSKMSQELAPPHHPTPSSPLHIFAETTFWSTKMLCSATAAPPSTAGEDWFKFICQPVHYRYSSLLYHFLKKYMFQCYSLKSSHPYLLPQNPKVCSLHLCLFCCLAYKVIVTVFLNSIYMS